MAGDNTCTCDPALKPAADVEICNTCGERTRQARCDYTTYTWVKDTPFSECSVASKDDCDMCALDPSPKNCCTEDEQRLVDGTAQTNLPLMVFNKTTRRCECPAGTTAKENEYGFLECFCTNVASNKAQCCPGEKKAEGVCWTAAHYWKETGSTSDCRSSTEMGPGVNTCKNLDEVCSVGAKCMLSESGYDIYHPDQECVTTTTYTCIAKWNRNGW